MHKLSMFSIANAIDCCRFQKYYKSLFLGLVDMVLVNVFIIRNLVLKINGEKPLQHYTFYKDLQAALVNVTMDDFRAGLRKSPDPPRYEAATTSTAAHELHETNDTRPSSTYKHKRQRTCKVCAMYKVSNLKVHIKLRLSNCFGNVERRHQARGDSVLL